jgi:hypothetical protein
MIPAIRITASRGWIFRLMIAPFSVVVEGTGGIYNFKGLIEKVNILI